MGQAKKRKPPAFDAAARARMVKRGDVAGLYRGIMTHHRVHLPPDAWQDLMRAIEVKQAKDPAGFAHEMLGDMVGFASFLALRTRFTVESKIEAIDERTGGGPSFRKSCVSGGCPDSRSCSDTSWSSSRPRRGCDV